MVREKEAKAASLIIVGIVIALRFFEVSNGAVGLFPGNPFWTRFTYQFFHASLLHCVVNCWCLLSIVFLYDVSWKTLLVAIIIAATYPIGKLSFLYETLVPTVGLSGMCYALLGSLSFRVRRRLYFQGWMAAFIAAGFFFSGTNAWLHLYCYVLGVFVGFLNKPVKR